MTLFEYNGIINPKHIKSMYNVGNTGGRKMVSKFLKAILAVSIIGVVLTGCSTKEAENKATSASSGVKKILVGTEGTYKPHSYKEKDGKLTGYDVEILREIDKRIDDLEFEFVAAPWDSIFLGLDSNKYQIIANNITKKPDREEKYLFTKDHYFMNEAVLIVKEDNEDIKTIEDLKGKKVPAVAGTAVYEYLQKFNEKNKDNPITVVNVETDPVATFQQVQNGMYDASIYQSVIAEQIKAKHGLKIKTVTIPNQNEIEDSRAYFLFRKDQNELKEKVDKALAELISDGTLSKLSVQFFEGDYSK